jgi:hypothetical protein
MLAGRNSGVTMTVLKGGLGATDDDDLFDEILDDLDAEDAAALKKVSKESGWSLDDLVKGITKVVDGGIKVWNSTKGLWQDPPAGYTPPPPKLQKAGMDNTQMMMLGGAALVVLYLYTQKKK